MTQSEITASYGQVFENANDGKSYISKTINLKFIPDKVSFTQYFTVLLKSPDYLLKFWNSVILTAPIVFAQLMVASIAAYGFTRWRGKVRDSLFFFYVILMLMPYQVTLVPNYLVSDWLHLLNTRWAIFLPGAFAPIASFSLLEKAVSAARKTGKEPVVGNIVSSDTFYEDIPSFELWQKMGVLAVEMEAAALYMNAARSGKNALCICTISDLSLIHI